MYLFPPRYNEEGLYKADKTSWIRIRRLDGQFILYFYNEVSPRTRARAGGGVTRLQFQDAQVNTRPGVLFEIGVRSISGLMSLGYKIGAIMHRCVRAGCERRRRRRAVTECARTTETLFEDHGLSVSKDFIPELNTTFIQVKVRERRRRWQRWRVPL